MGPSVSSASQPAVFAVGDVTGAPQFVYVAAAQGTLAAENAVAGAHRTIEYVALPRLTFTTPNIAAVGRRARFRRRRSREWIARG